ncbi:2-hydroxyacid dehydrogenase [Varunaivibrio sulfuroxidans]|uniref:Lactate dehydrogenase-like 2-hydroxyacid dehydrogenase n=1 Tax=Varunaivibrio sulfuroxidans TaxID=1773489 RepID=A0A4R3JHS2_9PROT|nr:D-glycerate dehydrogenase [Varunaivibrio sulfuroxidans]TCS64806.1 lactate dehydrogenase-like 2-hydroxyacid dehydrogenase [Varunaivibrio sulfuroxidans]WES29892.1 D-glycerate dehydrogenase [Varunaivibrio sulfuroxidans]
MSKATDKPRVLVTRKLPDAVEARLRRDYDAVLQKEGEVLGAEEIAALAEKKDVVLSCAADPIRRDTIDRFPQSVRMIANYSVGFEHIDLEAARARGIVVTNTPDVLTDATADMAMMLMLSAARRMRDGEKMLRDKRWTGWNPTQLMGIEMTGKRLGIIGMGRIGRAVARRARAFDMTVHYHNRNRLTPEHELGAIYHGDPEELLRHSDFLSLHCPLTPTTRHFINAERIALLPERAVVVNTARGPVIDDAALIDALRTGRVAAAGLDVFEGEPDVNPGYFDLPNLVMLPHMGSATVETRNAMGFLVLDNMDAFFRGEEPPCRIA